MISLAVGRSGVCVFSKTTDDDDCLAEWLCVVAFSTPATFRAPRAVDFLPSVLSCSIDLLQQYASTKPASRLQTTGHV